MVALGNEIQTIFSFLKIVKSNTIMCLNLVENLIHGIQETILKFYLFINPILFSLMTLHPIFWFI